MLEKWIDKLNQEVDEVLTNSFKIHEIALELVGSLNQHVEDLDKQDEEYKESIHEHKNEVQEVSKDLNE